MNPRRVMWDKNRLDAAEAEAGVCQAVMTFADGGRTHAEIQIDLSDGSKAKADSHFEVAEAH